MVKGIKKGLVLAGLLAMLALAFAVEASTQESFLSGMFAPIGIGARPLAMGGAYTALADDLFGLYWNPAGLTQQAEPAVGGMATNLYGQGIMRYDLAWGIPGKTLGGYVAQLTTLPEIDLPYREETIALVGAKTLFERRLTAGMTMKYLSFQAGGEELKSEKRGIGLDVGFLASSGKWKGALVVNNLLAAVQGKVVEDGVARNSSERIPFHLVLGGSYQIDKDFVVTLDLWPISGEFHLGAEKWLSQQLALRVGWAESPTAGVGIRVGGALVVDYAFLMDRVLPTQKVSVQYLF